MPELSHNFKAPAPCLEEFPADIRPWLVPEYTGDVVYECIACGASFGIDQFLYTCPKENA
jgi:threonine synthase